MTGPDTEEALRPPKPRFTSAVRLAGRSVWQAAREPFAFSIFLEVLAAISLGGVLLFGRQVVTKLTADPPVSQTSDMLPATVGLAVSLAVSGITTVALRHVRLLLSERVARHIQAEIVQVASTVPYQLFEDQHFHDQLTRSNAEASRSAYQLVFDVMNLLNVAATSIVVVLVLVRTVPEVLPVLVLLALPSVAAARASARIAYRTAWDLTPDDRLRFYLFDALTRRQEARELRVFQLANPLGQRWNRLYDERLRRLRALSIRRATFEGIAALIAALLIAAVLLVLVDAAVDGRVTLGDAAVAIVALQQLTGRLRSAAATSGSLRESTLFLSDFETFRRHGVEHRATEAVVPAPSGKLIVDGVSFRYPGTDRLVLDDVSVELEPGSIVALVGLSGSGKTTLAHLVSGLYEPTSGRITYGGVELGDIPRAAYWRAIAPVFQDFVRYELTAFENIAMHRRREASDLAAVRLAAQRAGIDDVVERLAAGYDTMMSRAYADGAELSVGQWQRMAVARAFFRDAPILVLDEPAAALDAIAERQLYDRLVELCEGRSVLLISHRFSTVRMAKQICVMNAGRIVERGTHAELMAVGGQYAELYTLQASSYLDGSTAPVPNDGATG
jgi:ATP-binding cassette subfamily B protein